MITYEDIYVCSNPNCNAYLCKDCPCIYCGHYGINKDVSCILSIISENGRVKIEPQMDKYFSGMTIKLEAIPDTNYDFVKFVINGEEIETNPYSFRILQDTSVIAIFQLQQRKLTIGTFSNGKVLLNNEEVSSGEYEFPIGTEVVLEAVPDEGYVFVKWSPSNETDNPIEIILDEDKTYTPIFEEEES